MRQGTSGPRQVLAGRLNRVMNDDEWIADPPRQILDSKILDSRLSIPLPGDVFVFLTLARDCPLRPVGLEA
jgi:hypothetical protein